VEPKKVAKPPKKVKSKVFPIFAAIVVVLILILVLNRIQKPPVEPQEPIAPVIVPTVPVVPDEPVIVEEEIIMPDEPEPEVPTSTEYTVLIKGGAFQPKDIIIKVGDSVTWKNLDVARFDQYRSHRISETKRRFRSDVIPGEGTFTYTFTEPGTYNYFAIGFTAVRGSVLVEEVEETT